MSRKQHKQRRTQPLARANHGIMPSLAGPYYVPAGQPQNAYTQTFYGSQMNIPVGQTSLFSPGTPLLPQPNVDPLGKPVQFPFPLAYNSFPVDRSLGRPDVPPFQQLRLLAKTYSGIGMCERVWADLVPSLKLKIKLRDDLVAQGMEEKDYQKEISYFLKWFEKPDGRRDLHTWLRMALREQTQIDELYIYKNRKRNGELLGLHIIAGDSMKPILNDWGDIPLPDDPEGGYAYQQYPWGIPGMLYSTDMMIHYQESPAADSAYGQSRVERIIMEVNQALRKKRRDLAMFTEGNIPAGFVEVPETSTWTPDQIDAYEQSWNALMAGNPQQQVRLRFMQPGMKYIKLDNGEILTDFDLYILKISAGQYGVSLQDIAFTEDIHKSSGDSQQNVLYRRTVGPLATVYGGILTDCMQHDFDPSLHGDLFELSFAGYEEKEDFASQVAAYRELTDGGIMGLSDAAKALKLPEGKDAQYIGRVFFAKDGPVFLDDMAKKDVRQAALDAKIAGFEMAKNPPEQEGQMDDEQTQGKQSASRKKDDGVVQKGTTHNRAMEYMVQPRSIDDIATKARSHLDRSDNVPQEQRGTVSHHIGIMAPDNHQLEREGDEQSTQQTQEVAERGQGDDQRAGEQPAERAEASGDVQPGTAGADSALASADYRRWRTRAIEDAKAGRAQRPFVTTAIAAQRQTAIWEALERARTPDDVREVFARAQSGELQHWQDTDKDAQQALQRFEKAGVKRLKWTAHGGACDSCLMNDGQVVNAGQRFPSGAFVTPNHGNCECTMEELGE